MDNSYQTIHPNQNHIIGDVIKLGKDVVGEAKKILPKFGYKKFIAERDKKLNELKAKGFNSGPLLQANGFTHAQIKKNLLKDYTEDFARFMDTVYYPLIGNSRPAMPKVPAQKVTVQPKLKPLLDAVPANIIQNIAESGGIPVSKTSAETLPKTAAQKQLDIQTTPERQQTTGTPTLLSSGFNLDFKNPWVIAGLVLLVIAMLASIIKR